MLRVALALGISLIAGCAVNPIMSGSPQAAEIVLRESQEEQPTNRVGGMFVIGGQPVPDNQHFGVWVSPGSHKVEFLCPGWMFIDGYPAVRHRFEAGRRYELVCDNGPPRIELSERPN